jgi:uncharacterized protein
MDRLFLDANILFSAAYAPGSGLARLWSLPETELMTSERALEEARRNLARHRPQSLAMLRHLMRSVRLPGIADHAEEATVPIELAEKDRPIMQAAIAGEATHLITGDLAHFGRWFGDRIGGVLVMTPGAYLRLRVNEP